MSAVILTPPVLQFFDDDGNPLSGGLLYTYVAGTVNTPKATFTDSTGAISLPNPIILDAAGRTVAFGLGSYKFVLQDSTGATIRTVDNVTTFQTLPPAANSFFQSFSGDGATQSFTLSSDLGTDEKTVMVFVSAGNVVNTPLTEALTAITAQTVYTTAGHYGTDPKALMVFVNTTTKGYEIVPSTGYTIADQTLTLSAAPTVVGAASVIIFKNPNISGGVGFEIQSPSAYTINGTNITFAVAPPLGTNNIQVWAPSQLASAASSAAAQAQQSASDSATSASASAASAVLSANSATAAGVSATASANSATASATSATNSATSATNSANSATAAAGSATTAGNSATAAANSATAAQASAQAASGTLFGTSTTSNSIATGSKSFTTQTGLNINAGGFITVSNTAAPANFLHGQVTSYNSGTGALVVNVLDVGGTGTFASWNISPSGPQGPAGAGSGTVNSGNANQMAFYAANGTTVSGDVNVTATAGAMQLGVPGTAQGSLALSGSTSGTTTLQPAAAASGTIAVPAGNDTMMTNNSTATVKNKTFDSTNVGTTQSPGDNSTKLATTAYADAAAGGMKVIRTTVFNAGTGSGTFTPNANTLYAKVRLRAGGGGAGSTATNAGTAPSGSAGGGEGGYAEKTVSIGAIGASQAITIGTGGASNGTGGTTSFGAIFSASGGSPGSGSNGGAGGAGGIGSGGDLNLRGQAGGNSVSAGIFTVNNTNGYTGGTGGGEGGGAAASISGGAGTAGSNGGGGGGGSKISTGVAGATGGAGWVIIDEYGKA